MTRTLLTPPGTPATRGDRLLAVVAGAICGAMMAGMFVRGFLFAFT